MPAEDQAGLDIGIIAILPMVAIGIGARRVAAGEQVAPGVVAGGGELVAAGVEALGTLPWVSKVYQVSAVSPCASTTRVRASRPVRPQVLAAVTLPCRSDLAGEISSPS